MRDKQYVGKGIFRDYWNALKDTWNRRKAMKAGAYQRDGVRRENPYAIVVFIYSRNELARAYAM